MPERIQICLKISHFHYDNYDDCRLLGYKNPVPTSQGAPYFSTTEPSQLMISKMSGFHRALYEELLLLGYKNPVRTSQETHYFSATELSRLMLCTI
jgi:hypothetical protein